MRVTHWRDRCWQLALIGLLSWGGAITSTSCAVAQLRPMADTTSEGNLGTIVQPLSAQIDLIKGGTRPQNGANLFHSFSQFSIDIDRAAYFDSPAGVENILSRVTGSTRSEILGTLGVNGAANLFLLNPNGILFGPHARLEIAGSFVASAASRFKFADGNEFGVTTAQAPPLLTVNLTPGLQIGATGGTIVSTGKLAVGQDLALVGGQLDLRGQLTAGGNLYLQAGDTLRIQDSITQPFTASARGKLWMQGNQQVDITALNHPNSGFFAGGDLMIRSANPVNGDAHYATQGNFRIEQLDGTLGNLASSDDPIIRASGDVSFTGYLGASLHVLAGGSVNIGTVIITGADTTGNAINPTTTPDLANITLSNGTPLTIDGTARPTLDIRAGTTATTPPGITGNNFFLLFPTPNVMSPATSSNITLGTVLVTAPNGQVFLTNQFQPNQLPAGTIQVGTMNVFSTIGNGSSVAIDSRGGITIPAAGRIDTSSSGGTGGNITLLAGGAVSLADRALVTSSANGVSNSGNITVAAKSLSLVNGATIQSSTFGSGNAGNITVNLQDAATFSGTSADGVTSGIQSNVEFGGTGSGGEIKLTAASLSLLEGGQIQTIIRRAAGGALTEAGTAGKVTVDVQGAVTIDGVANANNTLFPSQIISSLELGRRGKGGDITLKAGSLSITNGGLLTASTSGTGDAGKITVQVKNDATFSGSYDTVTSGIQNNVESGGVGNGGDVNIQAGSLSLANGAQIQTIVRRGSSELPAGKGTAGNVTVDVPGLVSLDGVAKGNGNLFPSQITSVLDLGSSGKGGDITIKAGSLSMTNGALLSSSTFGTGDAGKITVQARDNITFSGAFDFFTSGIQSNVESGGVGNGGDVTIKARNLSVQNGGQVQTIVRRALPGLEAGRGTAGNLLVDVQESVNLDGVANVDNIYLFPSQIASVLDFGTSGKGGDITIKTNSFSMTNGASLNSSTSGQGDAGKISIQARGDVLFDGFSNGFFTKIDSTVQPGAIGSGGGIDIAAKNLFLSRGAVIGSASIGRGTPGDVNIAATDTIALVGSRDASISTGILTAAISFDPSDTTNTASGGNVFLQAPTVSLADNSSIFTNTLLTGGRGGRISVVAAKSLSLINDSFLSTGSLLSGSGGDIDIQTGDLLLDQSSLTTSSLGTPDFTNLGAAGNINVRAGSITLNNTAGILANTTSGNGGNVSLDVQSVLLLRRNSSISTTAGAAQRGGDGGNITINAPFVVSAPLENSDITANAFTGSGGRITINAQGIFWLVPRSRAELAQLLGNPPFDPSRLPTNDITASSESGVNGIIAINTPDIDPSRGLVPLPTNLVDPSNQIAQGCQNRNPESASAFVATGRGGLPPSPTEPLQEGSVLTDWVSLRDVDALAASRRVGERMKDEVRKVQVDRSSSLDLASSSSLSDRIIEAQGWIKNAKGEVLLVTQAPSGVPHRSLSPTLCQ